MKLDSPVASSFSITVTSTSEAGLRLDILISERIGSCSRSYATKLIHDSRILVNQSPKKPGYRLKIGDQVSGHVPRPEPIDVIPENIPLNVVFEDPDILVLNKPPGIVVHPSPGHIVGTLVNALLHHCPDLEGIGGKIRPGIVHRLDKDTSGLLLVAKTSDAHQHLIEQFRARSIQKFYLALVHGRLREDSGEISLPIGRHPTDRKKMSTRSRSSRNAVTLWKVQERFDNADFIQVNLKTGRTHQIRVHFSSIQHPILGDTVYGGRNGHHIFYKEMTGVRKKLSIPRQMLHAHQLTFVHPKTRQGLTFEAPIPDDMQAVLDLLRS